MKHFMKWMATAIVAGTVALVNVKVVLDANRTNDLVETTLETFGQNTGGGQESNNHGSGKFYYEHLRGRPEKCTIYRHVAANGTIIDTTDKNFNPGFNFTSYKIEGMMEVCPDDGNGCTVYSCQQTN